MNYWDSSALVALYVRQSRSDAVRTLRTRHPRILTWTLSDIEIRSALARLDRDNLVPEAELRRARDEADRHWEGLDVITMVDAVKSRARRLLARHPLRAADALQLAAALTAAQDDPAGHTVVTLDARLAAAAHREGFGVLP